MTVATVASQVDAGPAAGTGDAACPVADRPGPGVPVEQVEAAAARASGQRLGEHEPVGLELAERHRATLGRVDVDDDEAGPGPGGHRDVGGRP